jgi:hydroxymethylglutaryl-CoA lyase
MDPNAPRPAPRLVEVGPRDGLQTEKKPIPLDAKVAFIDALSETGLREIEAGSFVNPKFAPHMGNSEQVLARVKRRPGVVYSAVVGGEAGLDLALAVKVGKIVVLAAATETSSRKVAQASIRDSVERMRPVVARARAARLTVRGCVATAFWCPHEGRVEPEKAAAVVKMLSGIGVNEFSIGDTTGKASPDEVRRLLFLLLKAVVKDSVFLHFHNSFGRATANAIVAWKTFGVSGFEASAGGVGGCPYAPGAAGNVSTEALVSAFHAAGADAGVDEAKLKAASAGLFKHLGRPAGTRPPK